MRDEMISQNLLGVEKSLSDDSYDMRKFNVALVGLLPKNCCISE